MVNVFGKEDRPENGKDGKDALPITTWFPGHVVTWWRNQSDAVYYFEDKTSGFIYRDGKRVGLKSHTTSYGHDAISEGEIGELEELESGGYSLHFNKSLYSIPKISLASADPMTSSLTVSFKVSAAPSERGYIISTEDKRDISIEGEKIQVWGCENEPIEIPLQINEWNIVFIQWKEGGDYAGYIYQKGFDNDIIKHFTASPISKYKPGLHIGKNFHGQICAIDVTNHWQSYPEIPLNIPIEIRNLLIRDHINRTL